VISYDQEKLFIALAFIAVILKDGENVQEGSATKIMMLARMLSDFCTANAPNSYQSNNDPQNFTSDVDTEIEQHIKNLRGKHETTLPEDFAALMRLYTRLQFRKIHRINAVLFDKITTARLADHVLSQLDGEIDYLESAS